MFYKLLFILAIYHLFKSVKELLNRESECEKGEKVKMSTGKCVSVTASVLFSMMGLFVCFTPTILLWR